MIKKTNRLYLLNVKFQIFIQYLLNVKFEIFIRFTIGL